MVGARIMSANFRSADGFHRCLLALPINRFLFDETQLYRNLVSLAQPLADAGNFREAD